MNAQPLNAQMVSGFDPMQADIDRTLAAYVAIAERQESEEENSRNG
jgi:hypothetical protein